MQDAGVQSEKGSKGGEGGGGRPLPLKKLCPNFKKTNFFNVCVISNTSVQFVNISINLKYFPTKVYAL